MWPFSKKTEKRATSATGYTASLMEARANLLLGRESVAELTASVQSCVSLWENGLSMADVMGTDLFGPSELALAARSLAMRGEFVALLDERGPIFAHEWDVSTKHGRPTAYRLSIADTGGGYQRTALAGEVIHVRIGCSTVTPYVGTSPLKRSGLSAALLQTVESALAEVFATAPIGTSIVSLPESQVDDLAKMRADFKGRRGGVLIVEGVSQAVGAGQFPDLHKQPQDLTPQLARMEIAATLRDAQNAIQTAFGVLPSLSNPAATGPQTRECQRHLAQWTLAPICKLIGAELTTKLETPISLDVLRPTQAYDAGGRARAALAVVAAQAQAKEAGLDLKEALDLVDWNE